MILLFTNFLKEILIVLIEVNLTKKGLIAYIMV
jgi:hypothetical protein